LPIHFGSSARQAWKERKTVPARQSPTVRRRRLGLELRRHREAAELTTERVAELLECSHSKISRIETGQVRATPRDVRDMLEIYGVDGEQREALIQLAREARQTGWWHAYGDVIKESSYVGLEAAAASIRTFEPLVVPGLFQTTEYARAVLRAIVPKLPPERIERQLELRMTRQLMLTQADPAAVWVVLDEAALRRPVGESGVMIEQLHHLTEAAALPTVTIQVLPFPAGEHPGFSGAFTILGFPEPADPDIVYIEHASGDLYLERAEEIQQYALRFDYLRAAALAPDDSAAFLAALLKELL
jgi:transcriptional regulator with XRE-family HTH domain